MAGTRRRARRRARVAVVGATAIVGVACTADDHANPAAAHLADRAEEVADRIDAGDVCGALDLADQLVDRAWVTVSSGELPTATAARIETTVGEITAQLSCDAEIEARSEDGTATDDPEPDATPADEPDHATPADDPDHDTAPADDPDREAAPSQADTPAGSTDRPARSDTSSGDDAPDRGSEDPPGRGDDRGNGEPPGRSGDAPGRSGDAPGRSGDAPGRGNGGQG